MDEVLAAVEQAVSGLTPARIVVGFSGGPDSVVLLHALHRLSGRLSVELSAAHFNHGMRRDAHRDARFCSYVCSRLNVPLRTMKADVAALAARRKWSPEQAARNARYAFLNEAARQLGAEYIAVAHHMDDQAETVLLHLLRGCSLAGLSGMKPRSGRLLRPLLALPRSAIFQYLRRYNLRYRIDPTNLFPDYTRNRLRLELIPAMLRYNPALIQTLCNMASLLEDDRAFLQAAGQTALEEALDGDGSLAADRLLTLPRAVVSRALLLWLDRAGTARELGKRHIDALCALLSAETGARVSLPGGLTARLSYHRLYLGEEDPPVCFHRPLNLSGETRTPLGTLLCTPLARPPEGLAGFTKTVAHARLAAIPPDAVVRTRQPGDRFQPFGGGAKKLKDYLIDKKIPREQRDLPLLASGGEVLWLPGLEISEKLRARENEAALRMEWNASARYG